MQADPHIQLIEAEYPHIAKALKLLWGYPEANKYIVKLIDDCRTGQRQGFSPAILNALLTVQEAHQKLVKDDYQPSTWGDGREFFR
jgi:hypothetical protein